MRVSLSGATGFDFGLTGRECQDSFNVQKYEEIAYNTPKGKLLTAKVEDAWQTWADLVAKAPWLRNWIRSPHYNKHADSPMGHEVAVSTEKDATAIANNIYISAIWGYGLQSWTKGEASTLTPMVEMGSRAKVNEPMRYILKLQNVKCPNSERTYMWDDILYRGCGMHVPVEYGELDRWLEPLWLEVLEESSHG